MSDPPPATSVNQPNRIQKSQPEDTDVTAQHPLDAPRPTGCESETAISTATPSPLRDVDPQIIEALRGKDRIYVLKLGELMESLINDERRQRIELTPATSYQRLLVHRCSAYYKLTPEIDSMSKMIYVYSTEESRVPSLRISELVPPETTAAPAFKIMRRSSTDRRNKPPQAGSVTGEDGDLSDLEPSETGSLGGRSNTTGGSTKKHMTIEEREAAYNEARSRIFMGFEEKEKAKDKDINSSSSSLSVTSGSTKNGGSSAGDADSSSSSPATESEWSGPVRRGERRQNSGYASASSSTRSIRSSAYISNGSGSSRNSRAASPSSFQYPSLYEPTAPSMPLYDHSQQHSAPPAPIYHPPYGYPPYNQGQPNPPYMPYPAYYPPPYPPYSSPPRLPQTASDSATVSSGEPYVPPPPMPYSPGYMWPQPLQPPVQSPPMQPQPVPPQPPSNVPHAMSSPPPGQPPYPSYIPQPPPHPYTYSMPGYYPNQPGHPMPPPPPQPVHPSLVPVPQPFDPRANGSGPGNNQANCFRNSVPTNNPLPPNSNRPPQQRNGLNNGPVKGTGPKPRGGVTQPVRAPWSYGPGVGSGGMITMNTMNLPLTNETVGPRLSNSRRQTNMSNSSNGRSTSGDDGSSVASSASSSSRRTQTVNATGSQHPLPARPDWAINLKPQNNSRNNMSPITPPRSISSGSGGMQSNYMPRHPSHSNPPISLQSTDFPPLTTSGMQPSERRPTGAWGNTGSRPIFGQQTNSNAEVNVRDRLDETEYERPPPKSAELYNPKTPKRPPLNTENVKIGNGGNVDEGIVEQVAALSLGATIVSPTTMECPPSSTFSAAAANASSPLSAPLQ